MWRPGRCWLDVPGGDGVPGPQKRRTGRYTGNRRDEKQNPSPRKGIRAQNAHRIAARDDGEEQSEKRNTSPFAKSATEFRSCLPSSVRASRVGGMTAEKQWRVARDGEREDRGKARIKQRQKRKTPPFARNAKDGAPAEAEQRRKAKTRGQGRKSKGEGQSGVEPSYSIKTMAC